MERDELTKELSDIIQNRLQFPNTKIESCMAALHIGELFITTSDGRRYRVTIDEEV